tara:strand:+ start:8244 stop:8861 length:618 start_codon:yes stop_codon:yes gene_type:complete
MTKIDLNKIAPTLTKITTKSTGFQVPENYFDSIEDGVVAELKSININTQTTNLNFNTPSNYFDSLEDLVVTKLKAQSFKPKKDISIPDNYFETIEDKVLSKLKNKSKIITLKKVVKYVTPIAIAASFLLIFLLNNNSSTITFDSIASSEIEKFIENGNIDYDAESLALVFPDVELDDHDFISSISDNDVLNYLNENEIDELFFEN